MIITSDKTICLSNRQIRESFYRYFDKSANFAIVKWGQDNFRCPLGLKILDITQYKLYLTFNKKISFDGKNIYEDQNLFENMNEEKYKNLVKEVIQGKYLGDFNIEFKKDSPNFDIDTDQNVLESFYLFKGEIQRIEDGKDLYFILKNINDNHEYWLNRYKNILDIKNCNKKSI